MIFFTLFNFALCANQKNEKLPLYKNIKNLVDHKNPNSSAFSDIDSSDSSTPLLRDESEECLQYNFNQEDDSAQAEVSNQELNLFGGYFSKFNEGETINSVCNNPLTFYEDTNNEWFKIKLRFTSLLKQRYPKKLVSDETLSREYKPTLDSFIFKYNDFIRKQDSIIEKIKKLHSNMDFIENLTVEMNETLFFLFKDMFSSIRSNIIITPSILNLNDSIMTYLMCIIYLENRFSTKLEFDFSSKDIINEKLLKDTYNNCATIPFYKKYSTTCAKFYNELNEEKEKMLKLIREGLDHIREIVGIPSDVIREALL